MDIAVAEPGRVEPRRTQSPAESEPVCQVDKTIRSQHCGGTNHGQPTLASVWEAGGTTDNGSRLSDMTSPEQRRHSRRDVRPIATEHLIGTLAVQHDLDTRSSGPLKDETLGKNRRAPKGFALPTDEIIQGLHELLGPRLDLVSIETALRGDEVDPLLLINRRLA